MHEAGDLETRRCKVLCKKEEMVTEEVNEEN
jgi:hypothetical protein